VIARIRALAGPALLFGHGHLFRVFAARWLDSPPETGSRFLLDPATLNILSDYDGIPSILRWNAPVPPVRQ
jgi:probable phosphoglycerate mutase